MFSLGTIAASRRIPSGPPAEWVTSIDGSGTRAAGVVGYSGTYAPSGLSPAPTVYVDVLDGSTVIASETADTVSGGLFSGSVAAATGNTLRAEAVGGPSKVSSSGLIGTTVSMELP